MSQELEIMRVLVLSTAHLSQDEGATHASDWPAYTLEGEYGFISYVADFNEGDAQWEDWPGLQACAKLAREHGLEWVRFDRDAEEIEGLPTYDW